MLKKNTIVALTAGCLLLLCGTAVSAADFEKPVANNTTEMRMTRQKELMQKRYSKMDKEQIAKRKVMLEKRLEKETDAKRKEWMQVELEVLTGLAQ